MNGVLYFIITGLPSRREELKARKLKERKIYGTEGFKKRGKYKETMQDLEDQFDSTIYSNP